MIKLKKKILNFFSIVTRTLDFSFEFVFHQKLTQGQSSFKLLLAKNIQRPQLKWLEKIDNSNTPFVPTLRKSIDSTDRCKG